MASTLSNREDSADVVVDEFVKAGALETGDRTAVLRFASAVASRRGTFKQVMDRSRLASEVLPSLLEFESTVDIRLGFEKGRVAVFMPVALLHIDTDAQGQEVWLQLTRLQLEKIAEDLQETLKQMVEAENWVNKSGRKEMP